MTEIAAVLSFSASINNDKVGALFFSSKVEKFIPPKKGRSHLLRIIRELVEFEPEDRGTDIGAALRFLTNALKKRCTAFLLSDMIDLDGTRHPRYEDALKIAAGRHDISVINVYDPRERTLPNVGLVHIRDAETGRGRWINTGRHGAPQLRDLEPRSLRQYPRHPAALPHRHGQHRYGRGLRKENDRILQKQSLI